MSIKLPCALASALLLGATAAAAQSSAPAAPPPPVAAQPADAVPVPPPPAGKGQVVFFRHMGLLGAPYWGKVREHDVELGKLSDGVYFIATVEPGDHAYSVSLMGKDVLRLEVDPGETYYVEGRMTMALVGYSMILAPSDAASFQKAARGMSLAPPPTDANPAATASH